MSFEHGTLVQWNDARGFGFIKPDQENSLVFVHIKAFGPIARRPVEGDRVYFDSSIGEQGKCKATVARITESSAASSLPPRRAGTSTRPSSSGRPHAQTGWFPKSRKNGRTEIRKFRQRLKPIMLALLVPIIGVAYFGSRCSSPSFSSTVPTPSVDHPVSSSFESDKTTFECRGKQHCSQMTSKGEAQFYMANCPDVKVDGDGDGVACEDMFGH